MNVAMNGLWSQTKTVYLMDMAVHHVQIAALVEVFPQVTMESSNVLLAVMSFEGMEMVVFALVWFQDVLNVGDTATKYNFPIL